MLRCVNAMVGSMLIGLTGCGSLEEAGVLEDSPASGDVTVPLGEYCERVAEWDAAWMAFEDEVLSLVNAERAAGGACEGSAGQRERFSPSAPLRSNPALRCAARNHSLDMAANRYFAHENPVTRESPSGRVERAGYDWRGVAENIAVGQATPVQVVESWMGSFGHCTNILDPSFEELGVGYFDAEQPHQTSPGMIPGRYWTQNFGIPR